MVNNGERFLIVWISEMGILDVVVEERRWLLIWKIVRGRVVWIIFWDGYWMGCLRVGMRVCNLGNLEVSFDRMR